MNKFVLLIFFTGVLLFTLVHAAENKSAIELKYEKEAKYEWLATVVAVVPSLGHAYAGDWGRSLPMVATQIAGFYLMLYSAFDISGYGKPNQGVAMTGSLLFFGGKIWEHMDAYNTAIDYNNNLKKKYGLTVQIINNNPVLAATISF